MSKNGVIMRSVKITLAMFATMCAVSGCAANDLVIKRQTETEAKIEHLFQTIGGLEARLNELSDRTKSFEEKSRESDKELRALESDIRIMREAQKSPPSAPEAVQLLVPKVELVNPDPPIKGKDSGPPAAYLKAFGLYSANNFIAAIKEFELFIKEFPASDFVPNAWYWIGECYYSGSNLKPALESFNKVIDGWPRHPKAADAMLKAGYSYSALKQHDKARAAFEQVIRNYPGSPAALKARERLMAY